MIFFLLREFTQSNFLSSLNVVAPKWAGTFASVHYREDVNIKIQEIIKKICEANKGCSLRIGVRSVSC
mgnify:CR=1 FL=1